MTQRRMAQNPDQAAAQSIPDPELRARALADPEVGPLFSALQRSTTERIAQRLSGTVNDVKITQTYDYPLERIQAPTLVVHGTDDHLVPFDG